MSDLIGAGINPNWFSKWITTEGPFNVKVGVAVKKEYQEELKQILQAQQVQQRKQSMAAGQEIVKTPVNLTQEQLAYLRENYDPERMTQEQYNAFVADLEAFGVLSKGDDIYVRAGGKGLQLTPLESGCGTCAWNGLGNDFQNYQGNAAAWVRFRASFQTVDPETGKFYAGKQAALFGRIERVLERISG